jgi:hypothetical protein
MKSSMEAPQKNLKIDLPHDPAIPLLGIYPKERKPRYNKATCTPKFLAVPWKHPRCPTTEEWIKKMWYIYTVE